MYKMKNTVENFYRGCIKHLDDAEKHAHQASVDTRHVVVKVFDMHTLLICCVISFDFTYVDGKITELSHP